ncbi:MAG: outer membrane protein [Rhabdaerophilum sp.]
MKTKMMLAAAAALVAGSAAAADLPRRTAPIAPAVTALPIFAWTGFYAGVNAGWGFGQYAGSGASRFKDPTGFTGGGQIGYNYQMGNIVLGLETDLNYAHLRATNSAIGIGGSKATVDYYGTVRARAGIAMDRFLPYITGGFAYGGSEVTVPGFGKTSPNHMGWVAGAGVEYALTNNITTRIEAFYVDLDNKRTPTGTKLGPEFGVVRAGLNYKF